MFTVDNLIRVLYYVPIALFSLSFHELAHGYVAYRMGDPTAKSHGRLSLNPLAHLDPFGTLFLLVSMWTGYGIGWAKPVPVDPRYFDSPRKGFMLVSIAGPASNIILATLFGLWLRVFNPHFIPPILLNIIIIGTALNLSLAIFNLIPIPPLDGSRIILYFLRGEALNLWLQLEKFRLILIFAIFLLNGNILNMIVGKPVLFLFHLITGYSLG